MLHIDTNLAEMHLRWHPKPLAEEKVPGWRHWRPFCPEFRLIRPLARAERQDASALEIRMDGEAPEIAGQKAAAFTAVDAAVKTPEFAGLAMS